MSLTTTGRYATESTQTHAALYELRFSGEGPDLKTAPPAYAQIVDSLKIE